MELRNNSERAQWILVIFYMMLGFTAIVLYSDYMQYQLLQNDFTSEEADANDSRQQIVAIIELVIYLLAVVFFIMWFRRAYYNLHQTNAKLEFTEGWAAGAWFVPFINIVRPYQIMKEIWVKTQEESGQAILEPSTALVGWWWATLMIGGMVTRGVSKLAENADTVEKLETSTIATIAAELINIPSLLIVILLIKKVSSFEMDLYFQRNNLDLSDHLIKED